MSIAFVCYTKVGWGGYLALLKGYFLPVFKKSSFSSPFFFCSDIFSQLLEKIAEIELKPRKMTETSWDNL